MRSFTFLLQAAQKTTPAVVSPVVSKMAILHKILIGEITFKQNVPLKLCFVEERFGANWESELKEYTKTLQKAEVELVTRQIKRLQLTRYTTRELAEYLSIGGTTRLNIVSRNAQIQQAREYTNIHGEPALRELVEQEGTLANWTPEIKKAFLADVLKKQK